MQSVFECTAVCVCVCVCVRKGIHVCPGSNLDTLRHETPQVSGVLSSRTTPIFYHHRDENLRSRAEPFNCLFYIFREKMKAAGIESTIWAIIFKF